MSESEPAPPIDHGHRYCAGSSDVLHIRVKGQLELCMFDSRDHVAEHVLVLSVPDLLYLVVILPTYLLTKVCISRVKLRETLPIRRRSRGASS